jgi:cell division protein ZapB
LTAPGRRAYRAAMDPNDTLATIQQLAARIDKLMDLTRRLAEENRSLRQGQEQLVNERAQLLNKNELARSRVEAMIHRLKSLENNA